MCCLNADSFNYIKTEILPSTYPHAVIVSQGAEDATCELLFAALAVWEELKAELGGLL